MVATMRADGRDHTRAWSPTNARKCSAQSVVTPSVPLRIHYATLVPLKGRQFFKIVKSRFMMACSLGRVQINLTLLSLRCAIIKLRFMMACSLGRVQINLTLLSLHCAIIKLRFMMACSLGRVQINLTLLSLRCAIAKG